MLIRYPLMRTPSSLPSQNIFQNELIDCSAPQLRTFVQPTNEKKEQQLKEEIEAKRNDIISKDGVKIPAKTVQVPKEMLMPQIPLNEYPILPQESKTVDISKR